MTSPTLPQIDPNTGERITASKLPIQPTIQIDPATGERITSPSTQLPFTPTDQLRARTGVQAAIDDFASDLKNGGGSTALGRFLGKMQGRGDKGFTGLDSGLAPAAADFVNSLPLGLTHTAQGIAQIPSQPLQGAINTGKGLLEAGTIPSMFIGGPAAEAAAQAIPSAAHAGETLGAIRSAAKDVPINLNQTGDALLRVHELGQTGSTLPKAANQLLQRATRPNSAPINFPEARDFYSTISRLSGDELSKLTPVMKNALGNLRAGLHSDITSAATAAGHPEYAPAIAEYARAAHAGDVAKSIGRVILKSAGPGLVGAGLYDAFKSGIGAVSGK